MLRKLISRIYRWISSLLKDEILLVLGDSHALVFGHWWFKIIFPTKVFNICAVGGATASGLENPNSKTQARKEFERALRTWQYDKRIIVMLGEVDTGFVIWYRAEKYHTSVEKMLNQAITSYGQLLDQASQYGKLIVISTPLPTIEDNNDWGEVANQRRSVKATQLERTALTLRFNQAIERLCSDRGIIFVSLDKESIGSNGLVRTCLKNKNPLDHHYDPFRYALLLSGKLSKIF